MSRKTTWLVASLVLLALSSSSHARRPKPVTVVNPETEPVPVIGVENPALTAYQSGDTVTLAPGVGGVISSAIAEVPSDTRLVVEYVSVRCSTPSGNGIVSVSLGITRLTGPSSTSTLSFPFPIRYQSASSTGNGIWVGAGPVRLYADPGGGNIGVTATVSRQTGDGTTSCVFAISGHTVDM